MEETTFEQKIEKALENLDYPKIKAAMDALEWKWYNPKKGVQEIPDIEEIKRTASFVAWNAFTVGKREPGFSCGTGGFVATILKPGSDKEEIGFSIAFCVTQQTLY